MELTVTLSSEEYAWVQYKARKDYRTPEEYVAVHIRRVMDREQEHANRRVRMMLISSEAGPAYVRR